MSSSDSNHSLKCTVLVVVAFTKKTKDTRASKTKKTEAASRANTQPSSEYFSIRMPIILILWFVNMLSYGESKSTTTSYVLLSMSMMMSTSNFEYELRGSMILK